MDSFDFKQHLSEEEVGLLASPHKWQWKGSCFPGSLEPLRRHRKRRWLLEPGHCHTPPQRELLFSLHGATVYPFRDQVYAIAPGTVFLFDHFEMHGLDLAPGECDFRHLWLHLPGRDRMSSNLYSVNPAGAVNDLSLRVRSDIFVHLVYDAWSECAARPHSPVSRTLLQAVLTTAFLETLGRPMHQPPVELEESVVLYIEEYIENHLNEPLTLARLSKLAGYNPFSFHRIFKRHRKITLHRHIVSRRIVKAGKLLQQGLNLERVAEAVGMSSGAVFSRFFKSHAELPPSSWRKENRYEID